MNYLIAAMQYHVHGLKVIPFWNDGEEKKRFPYEYAKYRERQTEAEVKGLFAAECDGIALLCTDGIEAVDVDVKHDPKGTIADDLLKAIEDFGFHMPCLVQKTKSGGYHFIYKCPVPEGNLKLARRKGQKEAIIETRGVGGLLFVHPTPGYEFVNGGLEDLNELTATQEQRDNLIRLCRHFDEPEPVLFDSKVKQTARELPGKKPWEAYDESTDILEMMEHYGWKTVGKHGDYIRMNRPGAKHPKGVDGSVCVSGNYFYPFTSSDVFEPNKGYSPSAVYALMECRGDFSQAAKDMYKRGFGDRIEERQKAQEVEQVKEKLPELMAKVKATKFDLLRRTTEPKPLLKYEGNKMQPVAGRGMLGVFTGHEKSGKSFVLSCIAASGLSGGNEVLNFSLDLDGGTMLWFDTEQSGYFYDKTQRRLHRLAGHGSNLDNYEAYHLRQLSAAERLEVVEHFVYNTPGLSVVVLDGFVDLINDYNDLKETQAYVGRLMRWSDERQILILGVLHVNKSDGKIRGHIGSELKNKCDFVINTAKDGQTFSCSNPTSRYVSIEDFQFTRDGDGLPVYESFNKKLFGVPDESAAAGYTPTQLPGKRPSLDEEQDIPF